MKQEELIKIYVQFIVFMICMMFVFSTMVLVGQVRAEDNTTRKFENIERGFPKILDEDEWSSQLVYDTLGACYQGTIKWVIMSNPSLLGQAPGPMAMRQMMEQCVAEYRTVPALFTTLLDNKTKTDNETVNPAEVPDGETEDSQDQEQEESEGSPQTIFQG